MVLTIISKQSAQWVDSQSV